MKFFLKQVLLIVLIFSSAFCLAKDKSQTILLRDWLFSRDSIFWQEVTVPHDWAIYEDFNKEYDVRIDSLNKNDIKELTGVTGALNWMGKGYYKTHINLDEIPKNVELLFDGAMSEPIIMVNGNYAGSWAYGYNAFRIDITPYLKKKDNIIEVSLKNLENSSRWYPGGGLYRPVKLLLRGSTYIDEWESSFFTLESDSLSALLRVNTSIKGDNNIKNLKVRVELLDDKGKKVFNQEEIANSSRVSNMVFSIDSPKLWSPETPYLYTLVTSLYNGKKLLDLKETKVGIRTIKIDTENGFLLNGVPRKIKGVCLHHDLGPLGAAVNKSALIRQIKIMKEMGADAIRTSHNMPSTMQIEVCDSLGMMVMAESFDSWRVAKTKNDYSRFFPLWKDKDIENLILHFRSHPSIIMWSIGNEIPEQGNSEGLQESIHLQNLCHSLDPFRKVTQGLDRIDNAIKSGVAQIMDIPGFNYRLEKYEKAMEELPQGFLLGSETASTVSSRGVYKFPLTIGKGIMYNDGQSSSYDIECCYWSNLPDDDFRIQDENPKVIGQFVWTGFDYLGEPTPYESYWPSRSSYFGICDLAGLEKDRYYLYRSQWRKDSPTLHVLPHWTWPGKENDTIPIYCYTSYPSAELIVNGKSFGRKFFDKTSRLDRYRLRWNDVVYQPGELLVIAYDELGNKVEEKTIKTAFEPHHIELKADCDTISSIDNDLAFITVMMMDKDGNLCPWADNLINFQVTGNGIFKAACSGDATSLERFDSTSQHLFNGKMVVILEGKTSGKVSLTASSPTIKEAKISLTVK